MRIERSRIDRFGILAEQELAPLSPGVNLFLGRNEAGKSTCLRFFQSMLFGYKRGNRSLDTMAQRAAPLSGGSLELVSDSLGRFSLTRRPGAHGGLLTLTNDAGRDLDESTLLRLFGGLTVDVFDNIFAFSLKNLMEFSSLKGDSVRHALHGAAFGLGLQSPARVLKNLDERMSALLKRANASAAINDALAELEDLREQLAAREPDMRRYAELQSKLAALDEGLATLRTRRAVAEREFRRVRRRLDLWQQWEELGRISAEKSALAESAPEGVPLPRPFAPDAVQRLDALLARRDEQRLSEREAGRTCARLEADIAATPFAPELAALHREIQSLREQKDRRRAEAEGLPALCLEIEQLVALQQEALARLGPGWDAGRVAGTDCSIAVRERIQHHTKSLETREGEARDRERELRRLEEELAEALSQEQAAQQKAVPAPASPVPLPDKTVCADLAAALARAESALSDLPRLRENMRRAKDEARRVLAVISQEWDREFLATVDASSARQNLGDAARSCIEARGASEAGERLADEARAAKARAVQAHDLAEKALAAYADLPEEETLEARRLALEKMRTLHQELAEAERDYRAAALAAGSDAAAEGGGTNLSTGRKGRMARLNASPLAVGSVQLLLGGLALLAGGRLGEFPPFVYTGMLLTAISLPACLFALRNLPGRNSATEDEALRRAEAEARQRCDGLGKTLAALYAEAVDWPGFAPEGQPDAQALGLAFSHLEQQARRSALRERDRRELEAALQTRREAENRLAEVEQRCEINRKTRDAAEKGWLEALAALRLPESLEPQNLAAFFERLAAARSLDAAAVQAVAETSAAEEKINTCLEKAASEVFFREGLSVPGGFELPQSGAIAVHGSGGFDPDTAALGKALESLKQSLFTAEALREEEGERRRAALLLAERAQARSRAAERRDAAQSVLAEARESLEAEKKAWQAWIAGWGFASAHTPAIAMEILDIIQTFGEREKELELRRNREAAMSRALEAFILDVLSLAARAGIEPPVELVRRDKAEATPLLIPTALHLLDALAARAEKAARDAALLAERKDRLAEGAAVLERSRIALELTTAALEELLAGAGVADVEQFRAAFTREQRRQALETRERSLLAGLEALAAEESLSLSALLASLERESRGDLEQESANLKEHLSFLDEEATRLADERGSLREREQTLVDDQGSAPLRRREAVLKEELHRLSRRWAVAALAREILLRAKERLEQAGQQGVIRYAGDIFTAITGGEYTGIAAGLEGDVYSALHYSGDRRDPEKQLSQGAREQLYLALRLAYVKNHADKAESVPLILDDILVNFDPQRAANSAAVLAEFAGTNQIFFFTCHPAMAGMLLEAGRDSADKGNAPPPAAFEIRKGVIAPWAG